MSASGTASRINEIQARADQHQAKVEKLRDDSTLSEPYRRERIQQAQTEFEEYHRTARAAIEADLTAALAAANAQLRVPGDDGAEMRKLRAASRVDRLINAGMGPGAAAQVLAEDGDVDGLRALRDDVPSLVAATLPADSMNRQAIVEDQLLALDRVMAPLVTGKDAEAVRARLTADDDRSHLQAVSEFALSPTANARLKLAYSTSPEQPDDTIEETVVPSFAEALADLRNSSRSA